MYCVNVFVKYINNKDKHENINVLIEISGFQHIIYCKY